MLKMIMNKHVPSNANIAHHSILTLIVSGMIMRSVSDLWRSLFKRLMRGCQKHPILIGPIAVMKANMRVGPRLRETRVAITSTTAFAAVIVMHQYFTLLGSFSE
jgi:hypothetical protein